MVRFKLYNYDLFCGDQAIRWELEEMGVKPLFLFIRPGNHRGIAPTEYRKNDVCSSDYCA